MNQPLRTTAAEALTALLAHLGVQHALGISGGAVVPLHDALARSPQLRLWHPRSESGAAFMATELSLHTGAPVAVFTTTGPGLTNAITGMAAARSEGARVVLLSGMTSAAQRGRWGCQETSTATLPAGLFSSGGLFELAAIIEHPDQLAAVRAPLAAGFARPQGFVAHLALPLSVQTAPLHLPLPPRTLSGAATPPAAEMARLAEALRAAPSVLLWLGHGARRAAGPIRELAARLGAQVISTPRGKGIFPEDHPAFLGVTGLGGHARVGEVLAAHRPALTLVLGTRMGELSSFWSPALEPAERFIHIDACPESIGAAYPHVETWGLCGELDATLRALLDLLPPPAADLAPAPCAAAAPDAAEVARSPVRPAELFAAIQRHIVEGSSAVVMTEAGNALAWGNHALRFAVPGRYRVSSQLGAMGHFACGVAGVALTGQRAVAVVGDGAMLMMNELSTAVQHQLPATWIVLNDGQYGMIEHGMRAQGFSPAQTALPHTDFAALAVALGAHGVRVTHEADLPDALQAALHHPGPVVIDVVVDPREPSPFLARTRSLVQQGGGGSGPRPGVPGGVA